MIEVSGVRSSCEARLTKSSARRFTIQNGIGVQHWPRRTPARLRRRTAAVRADGVVRARFQVERRHAELLGQYAQRLLGRQTAAALHPRDESVGDAGARQLAL